MTDSSISDVARVRALLIAAAREGRAVSYSELLGDLDHRFTRPKMRAVCKTLNAIDEAAIAAGEPELAVLVVRESDRLPGAGLVARRARVRVGVRRALDGAAGDGAGAGAAADRVRLLDKSIGGAGCRNRTRDLRFTKPLLYQLS